MDPAAEVMPVGRGQPSDEAVPLVSAVIPTCHRPGLVKRAVESALSQTLSDIEVVVVIAAYDSKTQTVLSSIRDSRVCVLPANGRLNPSAARNRGVQASRGEWVAFLDDDDLWIPQKLEQQLREARRSQFRHPVVSCRMLARSRDGEFLWPRRVPRKGEPIGDYLFRRHGLLGGGGFLQSSTLFASRDLWTRLPFREDLDKAEDLDWALRANRIEGCGFQFAGEKPLVVWNIEDDRPRATSAGSWRDYAAWIAEVRNLVSAEAYASYLLTWVSAEAARQGAGASGFLELWRRARAGGKPAALDFVVHAGHWLLPRRVRRRLSSWLGRPRFLLSPD